MGRLQRVWKQLTILHGAVISLSLLLTVAAWQISAKISEARAHDQFTHQIEQLNALLIDRMQKYEFALITGVGTIRAVAGDINHSEWQAFSRSLALPERLPGINGIGLIERVTPENAENYVLAEQQDRPYFRIHPARTQGDYWPIRFIEPESRNIAAVGLDIAHETNRYQAALSAMRTGKTTITGPIVLVQDSTKQPGFLFFHPFYKATSVPPPAQREASFLGLVYAPFIMAKLMEGTLADINRLVHFRITDGETELYSELNDKSGENYDWSPMFESRYTLNVYGRTWAFDVQTTRLFETFNASNLPIVVLFGGLVITALILGIVVILSNARQRAERQVERKTLQLRDSLEQLKTLNRELEQQKQEAESATRVKSAFLANMSHEIRTPMNAIIGMLVLLQEARLDEHARSLARKAFSASEALLQLLNDILDLSKIEADHIELDCHRFDIDSLVHRSVELFAIVAEDKGLHLQVSVDPETPQHMTGDLLRIAQICTNLVGNAIKFTKKGRVTVQVSFSRSDQTRGVLNIEVQDTGLGIRPEDKEKIFENFRQADESTSRNFGGTGLGLAISQRLARLMNASLTVDSIEHEGTTFYLDVPVEAAFNEPTVGSMRLPQAVRVFHLGLDYNRSLLEEYRGHWLLETEELSTFDSLRTRLSALSPSPDEPRHRFIIEVEGVEPEAFNTFIADVLSGNSEYPVQPLILIVPAGLKPGWLAEFRDKGGRIIAEPLTPSKLYEELSHGTLKKPGFRTREPRPEFKHLQVLLVDDVPVNCQIVESYLAFYGVRSHSANTGDQALNLLRRKRFDLVLMDLHLDGETGQDVAMRIRAESGIKQPLIAALSASIAEDDRESARAAGMEVYLTKPVLPGDIEQLLRTYFSGHAVVPGTEPPASPSPSPQPQAMPGFIAPDQYHALFSHDPALFRRCVRSFLASAHDTIQELELCLENRDGEQLREIAHRIKGASANLADTSLQELAGRVELSGLSDDSDGQLSESLLLMLRRHVSELSAMEPPVHDTPGLNANADQFDILVARIKSSLGRNRLADNQDIAAIMQMLVSDNQASVASRFQLALDAYDFERAVQIIDDITKG